MAGRAWRDATSGHRTLSPEGMAVERFWWLESGTVIGRGAANVQGFESSDSTPPSALTRSERLFFGNDTVVSRPPGQRILSVSGAARIPSTAVGESWDQ